MKNFLRQIVKILNAKWIISKPKKRKVLIFDGVGTPIIYKIFNKNECEILYTRYEKINFYIFFLTIIKTGFQNLKNQYKINFIKFISPKFVVTAIDNDITFYKLKNIYSDPCYISIQNGCRSNNYLFFKNNSNLTDSFNVDYFFVFGDTVKKKILENFKFNMITAGSVLNNHYISNYDQNKENNSVLFISQFQNTRRFPENERIVFNILYNFCKKKKLSLSILPKDVSEKHLRKNLINGHWKYLNKNNNSSYFFLNKFKMIVFIDSTLGYEALSRRIKCACFPYGCLDDDWVNKNQLIPPIPFGYPGNYEDVGPFWSNMRNNQTVEEILEKVFGYSNEEWKDIIGKFVSNIMHYDTGNSIINKIINKN